MRFMLLIYQADDALTAEEAATCYAESAGVARELHAAGKFYSAAPLLPAKTAKSLRRNNGKGLLTDGPFAETREQLGGYFMVEAASIEEAAEIAETLPGAKFGTVEIRQVLDIENVPGVSPELAGSAVRS